MKRSTQQKFIEACKTGSITYCIYTTSKYMMQDITRYLRYDRYKYDAIPYTATYDTTTDTIYLKAYVVDTDAHTVVEEVFTRYVIPMKYSRIYRLNDLWIHVNIKQKDVRVYIIKETTI